MTHDICLGSDANIILVCTTEEAAEHLASVIREEQERLFQASDLEIYVRETDRDGGGGALEQEDGPANENEEDEPADDSGVTDSEKTEMEETGT